MKLIRLTEPPVVSSGDPFIVVQPMLAAKGDQWVVTAHLRPFGVGTKAKPDERRFSGQVTALKYAARASEARMIDLVYLVE